jgi:hypothetical protein
MSVFVRGLTGFSADGSYFFRAVYAVERIMLSGGRETVIP